MAQWAGIECIEEVPTQAGDKVLVPTFKCFEAVFARILQVAVSLAVLALFVMLVIGGFRYLTSGGDQKAATSARQTMTYAIAGIALMVVAYLIFQLIESFTGVTITRFTIPTGAPVP